MDTEELKALLAEIDGRGVVASREHGMIYQCWEDGEITLQKCGDLLWQRSLHRTVPPLPAVAGVVDLLPHTHGEHAYVFCATLEDAMAARAAIADHTVERVQSDLRIYHQRG